MGRVAVGQIWDTSLYGKVEIIEALPKTLFIGKFLDTGYITKPSQAQAFYKGVITDISVKYSLKNNYGYWKVIEETVRLLQPSGQTKRTLTCECVCGVVRDVTLDTLERGVSTNCGCVSREKSDHYHGEYGTPLYWCWTNMKARCVKRGDACNYQDDWVSFLNFKKWALSNGYEEGLILLRGTSENPDVGDYREGNCRWGTKTENYYDWKLAEQLKEK